MLHSTLIDKSDGTRASGGVPVNVDIPGLANPMAPVLSLSIHGRVPVGVVEDHRVRPCQVDSHASRSGAQDEGEVLGVIVEPWNKYVKK